MSQTSNLRGLVVRHASAIGVTISFLLALIGVPALLWGESWRAKYGGWAVFNGTYWGIIIYLVWLMLTRPAPEFLGHPRVIAHRGDLRAIIVQGAPWLSLGVAIALYIVEDKIERFICVGEVLNIQINSLVQLRIYEGEPGLENMLEINEIISKQRLDDIIIKPGLFLKGAP